MKKQMLLVRKKFSTLLILAFFMLIGFNSVTAQLPSLVPDTQAETMLVNEIPVLEVVMNNLTYGTPEYEYAARKYSMYVHTWEGLDSGGNLVDALTDSYIEFGYNSSVGSAAEGTCVSPNSGSADSGVSPNSGSFDSGDPAYNHLVAFLQL